MYPHQCHETKHFNNTMKFIDTVNKPIKKTTIKTTNKLTSLKKDIIKKVEKKIILPPTTNIKAKKTNIIKDTIKTTTTK